jgi:hypothetical protein
MNAYKSFTTADVIVTPFTVNKNFTFKGAPELTGSNVGIDRFYGNYIAPSTPFNPATDPASGQITSQYRRLVYNSIKQLYYSNFSSSRYNQSGSYDNYLPSTLNFSIGTAFNQTINNPGINRYFPYTESYSDSTIGVMSIPSKVYGEYITPGTFTIQTPSASIVDDGQGNLIEYNQGEFIGNIIYEHGLIILTNNISVGLPVLAKYGTARYGANNVYTSVAGAGTRLIPQVIETPSITCSFQSSLTLMETQYKCTFSPDEFIATLNPSIFEGTGSVYGFATGSYFTPYITTVGLYDDDQNLLAVAKLAQPVQSSNTTDTTVLVNLDR